VHSYAFDALIKLGTLATPEGKTLGTELLPPYDTKLRDHLRSLTISSSIDRPYASFQFDLAPDPVLGPGTTWADWIEPYQLATIAVHRYGNDDTCTDAPEALMLGLVDYAQVYEDYQSESPRRGVRVVGRSLPAVLSDTRWWHHWFAADEEDRTRQPPSFSQFFAKSVPAGQLSQEVTISSIGVYAIRPDLFKSAIQHHPVDAMKILFDFYLGTTDGPPVELSIPVSSPSVPLQSFVPPDGFIKLVFPNGAPLRSRLQFDAAAALSNFYDHKLRLTSAVLPSNMMGASCWQMAQFFCESPFTEFFSDTIGGLTDARVKITCRKPPWAGHIEYEGNQARVAYSTGGRPGAKASLFDNVYGDWDKIFDTIYLDDSEIIGMPAVKRGIDGPVFNTYEVLPAVSSNHGNALGDTILQREIPPLIDEDPDSPSYIWRYGVRPFPPVRSKYIPLTDSNGQQQIGDARAQSMANELLLREWFYRMPSFWSGAYVIRGRTGVRIGKRLVDVSRSREFYITGVVHHLDFQHPTDPQYTTTIHVTRGSDISPGAM